MCMEFYDDAKPLYLETETSGVGLGVELLQMCIRGQHAKKM